MCPCFWVSGGMLVMEEYKFESDGQQACGFGSVYGEPSWEDSGMYRCEGMDMWMQHFVCQRRMFTGLMLTCAFQSSSVLLNPWLHVQIVLPQLASSQYSNSSGYTCSAATLAACSATLRRNKDALSEAFRCPFHICLPMLYAGP